MYKILGKGVTTDRELNKVGKTLLGSKFKGVFPVDVKTKDFHKGKELAKSYFIINVDGSNKSGSHWLGVYYNPENDMFYIYDSYARGLKRLIPRFIKTIGYKFVNTNKKSDQHDHETSENRGDDLSHHE